MHWDTQKFSFSFDPKLDQEIIRLIESVPKGRRSRLARKVFRDYLDSLRLVPKIKKCNGCYKYDGICKECEGTGIVYTEIHPEI